MAYVAVITQVSTGESRRCNFPNRTWDAPDADWTEGEDVESFKWEDGNDACDCNRGAYFAAAGGERDDVSPCGSHEYRLDRIETDDGRVIERHEGVR